MFTMTTEKNTVTTCDDIHMIQKKGSEYFIAHSNTQVQGLQENSSDDDSVQPRRPSSVHVNLALSHHALPADLYLKRPNLRDWAEVANSFTLLLREAKVYEILR
jgi:hypothetical protein